MEASATERQLQDYFSTGSREIVAAYLFGSEGRGMAGPGSDVDVAILFSVATPPTLESPAMTLEGDLERLLGRAVEVVVLNSASVDLVHRVLRDGRLLFEANRSARIAFEVRARNEYFDLLPILHRYRRRERVVS
jgi:predicted nucleotidyltransferase